MANLIITLIAMAVFILFMGAGASYINYDAVNAFGDKHKITSALSTYHSGVNTYKIGNNTFPLNVGDFIPGIVSEPTLPSYMSLYSYEKDSIVEMVTFCFDAEISGETYFKTLDRISSGEGYSNFIISNTCGDMMPDNPSSYPSNKKITYIIR